MAMNDCSECSANTWNYEYDDGLIIATCNNCWHEVTFNSKKIKKRKHIKQPKKINLYETYTKRS